MRLHSPGAGLRRSLAAVAAASALGCGDAGDEPAAPDGRDPPGTPMACTRASCMGGADVRLRGLPPGAYSAKVCVDEHCEAFDRPIARRVRVGLPAESRSGGDSTRAAGATAAVRDAAGALLASGSSMLRLTALRPNGPHCTPTCWTGAATIRLQSR